MNKTKILTALTIVLLLMNLGLIGFICLRKPPRAGGDAPKKAVIQKLQLDDNQIQAYEKLIEAHRSELRKLEQQMHALRADFYATLPQDTNTSAAIKDSLAVAIGTLQIGIENIHYKHFQDIKNLCKPAQKALFDAFALEITHIFPKAKPSHPPK
jgi:periplasmic protein CpxP/Spy